jgi:type I restriction enzyme, S subunit
MYEIQEENLMPVGWKCIRFGKIASLSKEKFDYKKSEENYKCIELEHLSQVTGRLLGYTDAQNQLSVKNKFKKNDVLYGKLRPYLKKYYYADFDGVCSSEIWVLKGNERLVTSKFLFYLIQTNKFNRIANVSYGSKMPRADWDYISEIVFNIPSLREQHKINLILSTWDEAIEKTEKLIKLKEIRKKGLLQGLLTGNIRLKKFQTERWSNIQLKDFINPVLREVEKPLTSYNALGIRSHGKGTFEKYVEDPSTVSMDTLYEVKENDLIVNITFAWEGAIAIAKKSDEGKLVSHRFPTYVFDRSKVIFEYFKYIIIQPRFIHLLGKISPGGAGRNRVMNKTDFLKLKVSLPSIEEQSAIADILNTADRELELLEHKLEMFKQQKKSLMQNILSGKVRVKI